MANSTVTASASVDYEDDSDQEIIGLMLASDAEYEDIIAQALWPNMVEQWWVGTLQTTQLLAAP